MYPGNRYEVEYRYTGFVDLQSRPTWPRLNLAHLAKVLNARERPRPPGDDTPPSGSAAAAGDGPGDVAGNGDRDGDVVGASAGASAGDGDGDADGDNRCEEEPASLYRGRSTTPAGVKWDAPGVTDSGPLLRLNDPNNRLSKAERYGNPNERPMYASTIPPAEFLDVVKSFFAFGAEGAKSAPGLSGAVPRKGWTWRETHRVNAHVKWDDWVASQIGETATKTKG